MKKLLLATKKGKEPKKFIRFTSIVALSLSTLAFCTQALSSTPVLDFTDDGAYKKSPSKGALLVKSFFQKKNMFGPQSSNLINLINEYYEETSLCSLPKDLLTTALALVGTKGSTGVCKAFQDILHGTDQRRGIGRYRIIRDNTFSNEDLNHFSRVQYLELFGLKNVDDVSALGGVQHLELYNLPKVVDVSNLGGEGQQLDLGDRLKRLHKEQKSDA